jgi:uncharacterized membrane protein (DUF106 family)
MVYTPGMLEPKKMHKAALSLTRWIGSPQSIIVHTIIFGATVILMFLHIFPLDLVLLVFTLIISLEAIYLSLFIQLAVNYQAESIAEVGQDIDEIQEDVGEIQEDVDEIQEDVEELQEDVEEMSEEEAEVTQQKTLADIQADLRKLMNDIEKLQQPK